MALFSIDKHFLKERNPQISYLVSTPILSIKLAIIVGIECTNLDDINGGKITLSDVKTNE